MLVSSEKDEDGEEWLVVPSMSESESESESDSDGEGVLEEEVRCSYPQGISRSDRESLVVYRVS